MTQETKDFYKKAKCVVSYDSFGNKHILPTGCLKEFHANYEIVDSYNYAGEKFKLLLPKKNQ